MKILNLVQIVLATLLIITILLQAKGTGLGVTFGQIGDSYHSKRGAEKFIFILTIVLAVLFFLSSTINAFL